MVRDEQSLSCTTGAKTVTLNEPPAIGAVLAANSPVHVKCSGQSTGSIVLEALPVGASLEYSLNVAGTPVRPWQPSASFTNLPAATYTVLVRNGSCINFNALTAVVNEPATFLAIDNSVLTDITCPLNSTFGITSNGSISINVSGGSLPYAFQWFNAANGNPVSVGSGGDTHQINGMPQGSYRVNVTDAGGCGTTATYAISQPADWNTVVASSNLTVVGANDGSINITSVAGATAPLSISWSDGAGFDDLYSRTNLAVGNYVYTLTDTRGCRFDETVGIFDNNALSASLNTFANDCYGASKGRIEVVINNGIPHYSVLWTGNTYDGFPVSGSELNVGSIVSINNLKAGSYTVTVVDNNGTGASMILTAVISQPASPLALTFSSTDVTCYGQSNGNVSVAVSGGTPYLPGVYDISLFPVTTVKAGSYLFSGLNTGAYEIVVVDEKGCDLRQAVTISQPNELLASVVATNVNCSGSSTGSLTATVTGRTVGHPFSYDWEMYDGTTWVPYPTGGSAFVNNVPAGVYRVLVTSLGDGCTDYSDAVTVAQNNALAMNVDITDVTSCYGDASGRLVVSVTGGLAPYILEYLGPTSAVVSGNGPFDIKNLPAGTYTLQLSDANSCVLTQPVTIAQPTPLVVSALSHSIGCNNASNGLLSFSVEGGVVASGNQSYYALLQGPGSLSYMLSASVASGGVANMSVPNLPVGHYNLVVRDVNSSNPLGCQYSYSFTLDNIVITGDVTDATCLGINNGSILNVTIAGATPGYTWAWSTTDGSGLNASTLSQGGLSAGNYTLTVTDLVRGCVVSRVFLVKNSAVQAIDAIQQHVSCQGGNMEQLSLIRSMVQLCLCLIIGTAMVRPVSHHHSPACRQVRCN
jgi:large repetitive protein